MSSRAAVLAALAAAALACAGGKERAAAPRDAAGLAQQAQAALQANKPEEALAGFEEALAREPGNLAALRGRIEASRRLGRLEAVAAEAQARAAQRPAWAPGHYALGLARFAQGDEPAARAALLKAAELAPGEADVHYRLGLLLFDGEKFAEAKGPLTRAAALAPKVARYRAPLATCLDRLGDRKGAIAALRDVPLLDPTAEEAALAVKTARAITDPFRGVPKDARPELEQGLGYLLRDAPGLAVPALEALVQKYPDLGAAHALLGLAAQRLDEAGRAVTSLKRAAELSPDAPQPHAWLAELYAAKDRFELAAQEWEAALERDPLDVATLRRLGQLKLERGGAAQAALAPLKAAAALQPDDDGAQLLLARAELAGGQAPAGRTRLEKLAERRPDEPEVLLRLALALFDERAQAPAPRREELGRRVRELAEKVLGLQPENAAAARLLQAVRAG